MNLFFLSEDPCEAAKFHCNKHVVKMILETTQMLYTAHHLNCKDGWQDYFTNKGLKPYRPFGPKHPSTRWISETLNNYHYALTLVRELCVEKRKRWPQNPPHSCEVHIKALIEEFAENRYSVPEEKTLEHRKQIIEYCKKNNSFSVKSAPDLTPLPLAMAKFPECFKENAVLSYREYYKVAKAKFVTWPETPSWYLSFDQQS